MSFEKRIIIVFILFLQIFSILISQPDKELDINNNLQKSNLNISRNEDLQLEYIIEKKELIKNLINENSIDEVHKLFEYDITVIDSLCKRNDYLKALMGIVELEYIYNQTIFKQKILLQKGKIFINLALFTQAYQVMKEYITKFDKSPHLEAVKYQLQLTQFYLEKYEEIICLENDYKGDRDARYKFILSYSYNNMEKYNKAIKLLNEISSQKYKFFAQLLLCFYVYKDQNIQESIEILKKIINSETGSNRLEILYLILARFYFINNDYKQAVNIYNNYIKSIKINDIDDDIIYEMGWCSLNTKDYINAGEIFKKIIDKNPKSKYYDEAIFLFQIILTKLDKISDAMQLIVKKVNMNDSIYNYLEEKERICEQLNMEIFIPEGLKLLNKSNNLILDQETKLITQLYDNNSVFNEFHEEDTYYQKKVGLSILEAELLSHIILLESIDRIENIYNNVHLKDKNIQKNLIDRKLIYADSLLKEIQFNLEVNIILSQLIFFNVEDIEFIKNIIKEKIKIEKLKNNMLNQMKIVREKHKSELRDKIQNKMGKIDSLFVHIDLIIDKYLNTRRNQDAVLKSNFIKEQRLTTDLNEKLLEEKKKFSLILQGRLKKMNVKNQKELTELKKSLENIKNDLLKELSRANSKQNIELITAIHNSINNVDDLIVKVNIIYEKYDFGNNKPSNKLKQLFIDEQDTIKVLREKIKNKRKKITLELENKIKKIILDNKNNLLKQEKKIDKKYNELKEACEEILKQKVQSIPYTIKELYFQDMDLVNHKDEIFKEKLLYDLIIYENLLEQLEKNSEM